MRVLRAFLRRDWLIWSSYRFAFFWNILGVLTLVTLTYFIGSAVHADPTKFKGQATTFVSFILAGLAFSDAFTTALAVFPQSLRDAQLSGTLEPLLLTPIRVGHLLLASSLFRFAQSLVRLAMYALVGVIALGYWRHASILAALFVFVPACLAFGLLGTLSAAFVLVLKQGDPIITGYAIVGGLFGGALFPIAVLPAWVRPATSIFPLTYALSGVRMTLEGAPLTAVLPELAALWAWVLVLLPISLIAFNFALNHAKRSGTLVQY
ncbi:MAG: ABC transporter permease [Candidatus Dormibacteraeota bacterium]|nr:ABC transporter permease [Candidatus Dormibacteraeota bacterium]